MQSRVVVSVHGLAEAHELLLVPVHLQSSAADLLRQIQQRTKYVICGNTGLWELRIGSSTGPRVHLADRLSDVIEKEQVFHALLLPNKRRKRDGTHAAVIDLTSDQMQAASTQGGSARTASTPVMAWKSLGEQRKRRIVLWSGSGPMTRSKARHSMTPLQQGLSPPRRRHSRGSTPSKSPGVVITISKKPHSVALTRPDKKKTQNKAQSPGVF